MWHYEHLPISFTLVVDDLGVKYVGQNAANHLIDTLRQQYEISQDWTGNFYLGLELDWSYESKPKHVTLSMPKYLPSALTKLQYAPITKPEHALAQHVIPTYGAKIQYAPPEDVEKKLSEKSIKYI